MSDRDIPDQPPRRSERPLVELAPTGLGFAADDGTLVYANAAWRELYGFRGRFPAAVEDVMSLIVPEHHDRMRDVFETAERGEEGQCWLRTVAGRHIDHRLRRIEEPRDPSIRYIGAATDVTELTEALDAVRRSDERFRTITSSLPVAVFRTDPDGAITWANEWMKELSGYELEEGKGRSAFDLIHPDDRRAALSRAIAAADAGVPFESEHRFIRSDGSERWVLVRTTPVHDADGDIVEHIGTLEDVTGYHLRTSELAHAAAHDPLTGLPNRASVLRRLEDLCAASRGRYDVGLIFIDLDDFKQVNDDHGHQAGDAVLVEVARRLSTATRSQDLVGRLAGDEFMIVCAGIEGMGQVDAVAERARHLIEEQPIVHAGDELLARVSIGCSIGPGGGSVPDLIQQADQAMYTDKRNRRH
ncbi:sensor domain-containing diguanylate cyclase [Actinomarinicola tropica]|uniref:Diguanylate cyclase n=1 Tax=Actinomarinicola tropica TaxID=2789776 RepID=A0A5Q2RP89_9ACTN|nr:sensor domain-containing diguanylate cyclase [Actinomarinicola tropica]QGG95917.1 diguanylate cyclase [Actinomarinicola tropica]